MVESNAFQFQLEILQKENEVLLQEIHHRVKNNLQIISSLLDLQEDYVTDDPTAAHLLKESQNRVSSMALIYEMIYQSNDLTKINFSDYIKTLTSNLFHSYNAKPNLITIINVEHVHLNIETAVPLGLIISELISNSLKYAFPEVGGEIKIQLTNKDNKYELIVSDDGIGIPEDLNSSNTEITLGMRLVKSLVNQLDGTIKIERSQGTKFMIQFHELQYKNRMDIN
ncbi:MAG: sensor histidine kinase [Methanobacterium sp.]|nr:sensor histidine kinase [Methanobacterium sp.]